MQALPATANAVRRKPDGRREPAKRGPRPGGPVPLDPQRGGKKPDFTSKITIRRFLRRNPAFSDLIPARLRGRGIYLPQGFWFVKNVALFRRGRRPRRIRTTFLTTPEPRGHSLHSSLFTLHSSLSSLHSHLSALHSPLPAPGVSSSSSKSPGTSSSRLASASATRRRDWFRMAFSSVLRAIRPLPLAAASSACLRV